MSGAAPARLGIRGRLLLAFAAVAALSVVACVIGWLSYDRLSRSLADIADGQLPALGLAARLAEEGGGIIATAPILAAARTEDEVAAIRADLARRLATLRHLLAGIERGTGGPAAELAPLVEALAGNLGALDANVRRRFALARHNQEAVERLRWLHADFLDEIEPLVADARFNIQSALATVEAAAGVATPGGAVQILRDENRKSEAVLQIGANGNLAVGLIARAATLATPEALDDTAAFLDETAALLRRDVAALGTWPDALSLSQVVARLLDLGQGEDGLPALRRAELATVAEGQELLAANRGLVAALNRRIAERVQAVEAASHRAAARAAVAVEQGRSTLLAVALASLLVAVAVGWFYVRRRLVSRIAALSTAAHELAAGNLTVAIPRGGGDELSEMADALHLFREAQTELVQAAKLAALGQLAAGVGHELNQPLAAIRSYAHNGGKLIARGRVAEAAGNLARIAELTQRMAGITNHLKRFARRPDSRVGAVELAPVVHGALSLFAGRLRAEGVAVDLDLPGEPLRVRAEEVRLEQVLVNLLGNGLDAVAGRDCRRLAVAARPDGEGTVRIEVRDSGPGIPADAAAQVFDPFYTTKPPGAGLGLGLSISYNIVKDFGGVLAVASSGPEGTAFAITLNRA
ncbi:ATP-binding protein [Azospirillum sp. ST 5-10]|uniref:ATP-binding protein n=1 Tax=unclassified Azospirillum TaxID=2630922 RepID=UPI003F49D4C2